MRSARSIECTVCGPFTEQSVMVEFDDVDGDEHRICVDCLTGIMVSIDMPDDALNAFAAAWAAQVLDTNVSVVTDAKPDA